MKREIKLRVWDKVNKKMIYAEEAKNSKDLLALGLHGLPIAVDADSFRDGEVVGWNIDHNVIPLLFTGFLDKHGKEIYEGDIVTGTTNEFGELKETTWEVKYDEDMILLPFHKIWDYDANFWMHCLVGGCEVLGNIYQNPELVEVKP